jgi:hypothetical protein
MMNDGITNHIPEFDDLSLNGYEEVSRGWKAPPVVLTDGEVERFNRAARAGGAY